jgi:hypothetical protein
MLMLLGSWAFECVYVANQDATIYIYIYLLGLPSILLLFLIKLQQLFNISLGFYVHCVLVSEKSYKFLGGVGLECVCTYVVVSRVLQRVGVQFLQQLLDFQV